MAQQTINLGSTANDGTGDPLRSGGEKINSNFTELYGRTQNLEDNQVTGVVQYSTLAELPATGTLNVSYKVTNDGSNSGYYHWNGSIYIKDASLYLGEVSLGDVEAVEGGKIYTSLLDKADLEVGKNLYNEADIISGFFINYLDGSINVQPYFSYIIIKILPNTQYTWSNNGSFGLKQFAFYDENMVYVSGVPDSSSPQVFTTASNVNYVGFTFFNTQLGIDNQLELGGVRTIYEAYKKTLLNSQIDDNAITTEKVLDGAITNAKLGSDTLKKRVGKNKIDIDAAISGYFVSYTDGSVNANASFSYIDYTELEPSTEYTYWRDGFVVQQFAFYDEDKVFISGLLGNTRKETFTTPANCKYARFTAFNDQITANVQLELGDLKTNYEPYQFAVLHTDIEKYNFNKDYLTFDLQNELGLKTIITVDILGSGDFTNMRDALESITDATTTNRYEIQIKEGTYDIFADYTTLEIDDIGFLGLEIPSFVSLKGIGRKEKIILKGEISDTFSIATMDRVSTFTIINNSDLENLTITAKNLRYAMHDDYTSGNSIRNVINCDFIKYLGLTTVNPVYGTGTKTGDKFYFEDCYFYTEHKREGFAIHNNVAFTDANYIEFKNCFFDSVDGNYCARFNSIGSTTKDIIKIIGCRFNGRVKCDGATFDFDISGYGNDKAIFEIAGSLPQKPLYNFQGEHIKAVNKSTSFLKGDAVKRSSDNLGVEKMGVSDDVSLFYGVAYEDILADGRGIIRITGFMAISDTNLTGLSIGDKIGVTSGILAVVTGSEYVGVVISSTYILLK